MRKLLTRRRHQCANVFVGEFNSWVIAFEARNLVLVGANGLGKTMIAQNICHAAVLAGHSVLFRTASANVGATASTNAGRTPA
jgi:DNA replication protein DnaC